MHRAFNAWSYNSAVIHFVEVTDECERIHGEVTAACCEAAATAAFAARRHCERGRRQRRSPGSVPKHLRGIGVMSREATQARFHVLGSPSAKELPSLQ